MHPALGQRIHTNTATGIRTPVSAVRGRRPSPLDDGGKNAGQFSGALRARRYPGSMRLRPPILLAMAALAIAAAGLIGVVAYWTTAGRWIDGNALGGVASLSAPPLGPEAGHQLSPTAHPVPFAPATG